MGIFSKQEEEELLLGNRQSKKQFHKTYGSAKFRCSKTDEEDVQKVPLTQLFRYATTRDKWIIGIGIIASIVHGGGFPILAKVFGSMTNTFIRQAVFGFSNLTTTASPIQSTTEQTFVGNESYIPNSTSQSDTLRQSLSQDQMLTVDEFTEFMTTFSLYYVFIGLGVMISSFLQAICWEWACERQVYRLRQEFFYQVLRQEIAWFDGHQTGDLAVKLSDDLERIREGIGHKFSMVIQHTSTFLTGFVVGFFTSWKLTLVILSLTPLLAGASAFSGKMIATQASREQQKYGKAGAVAEEVLSCIRTVVAYSGEKREIHRYSTALASGLKMALKKYHMFAILVGFVFFIMYGSYALAFWYGCQLLYQDEITPGDVFTVFFSVLVGAFSLGNSIPYLSTISTAQGCGAAVFAIVDSMPEIDPYDKRGIMPDKLIGRIHFKDVTFRYPSRPMLPVLIDFNLEIEPGKTIGIVGPSGSGKSTIANLILRFYDPDSGSILIDGNDVRALNLAWMRYHIGYVSHDPVLFGTTIYENIRYGRDDVSPDEIVEAAKMANAHDFISALPLGYDSLVGERGSKISIGQKQRIAIARALVRSPRILLLDEATSALDSKSEAVVQMALEKAMEGRTTIIIAHRLSTIKDADIIYAIRDGRIAESGTHAQLMAQEGLYYALVIAQMPVEEMDDCSAASAQESADESAKEYSILFAAGKLKTQTRRKPRKNLRRRRKLVLPDPERSRLIKETEEVEAEYPGILKILRFNQPEWCLLIMGSIGCIITGAIMPFFAFFYSEMFSTFSKTGEDLLSPAFFWSMMFLALATLSFIGFWIRTICIASAGEYLTMRLRLSSFIGVIRQPIGWFDKEVNRPSRLSTRLARDAPLVKAAAGHRLGVVLSSLITAITALAIAFFFGWQLALVIVGGFPILVLAGYIQVKVQKGGQKKDAALMEEAGQCANEAIANIRTVQSLGQERIFFEKYLELLFPAYIEGHRQGLIYGTAFAFSQAVVFLIYAAAFRYGAHLVKIGTMYPIDVYRVFFEVAFCAIQVGQSSSWIPDYSKAKMAAALMFNLIELESHIDPLIDSGLKPTIAGHIKFEDVHFRYPGRPDVSVLRGLSIEVKPGHTLAVVGPSGCGKTTLVALLERFYDVVSGHVTIDGYDIRSLSLNHLRGHIGVVSQEPVMFDCSIRENIAYGYGDGTQFVPDDLIIEAARIANIHSFITSLPCGYHTEVGEKGTQLSAGQRQRIAIARAIIRDPKILLLDEATSALDTESEKLVQEALDKARAGRTCIVIAHRLSTIQNADCIALISRGRIAEMGTHEQLRNAKGLYYKLTKQQHITH
ncbi:Multidrug resistance protein 1 [Orchesella cincta]|uniref:ABC-type xenobiotic transporter n=1 Tax=Orchesella cincta TaxID=48709 RepID=A0A1D2N4C3_ORCCI|nr:Multidrug resistance protein 1 [Orchesella cincta]